MFSNYRLGFHLAVSIFYLVTFRLDFLRNKDLVELRVKTMNFRTFSEPFKVLSELFLGDDNRDCKKEKSVDFE